MKSVFVDDDIHRLLKLKAIAEHHSLAETVNSILRKQLLQEEDEVPPPVWLKLKGIMKGDKKLDEAILKLAKSWTIWKSSA